MSQSPDDLRINPYAHLTERVSPVRDQDKGKKRQHEHHPEEPHDTVELSGEERDLSSETQILGDDGLDIAV